MTLRYDNMVSPVVGDGLDAVDGWEELCGLKPAPMGGRSRTEGDQVRGNCTARMLDHNLLGSGLISWLPRCKARDTVDR